MQADILAEIGSCTVGQRRLVALISKYGLERLEAHKEHLFDATRRMMEAEIRTIPEGAYRGESTVYFDGKNPGSRYAIRVKITVRGDRIVFDYSGTDPQTNGFVNGTYTSSASAAILTFLQMVNPEIPHNDGMVQPIDILIPEGTILNAAYPAATTFGNHLCPPNADAIIRALAPVIPKRLTAGWNQLLCWLSTGTDPRRKDHYVDILFMGLKGGFGALFDCDLTNQTLAFTCADVSLVPTFSGVYPAAQTVSLYMASSDTTAIKNGISFGSAAEFRITAASTDTTAQIRTLVLARVSVK